MENFIAIDGGTTNTKIFLVIDGKIIDQTRTDGAKFSEDNGISYRHKIRDAIREILWKHSLSSALISRVLCSGMITSERGLCTLAHLQTPCGIQELAQGVYETRLEDISDIPFAFIPGVKTACSVSENADMMRGEETEYIGIADENSTNSVYVFPGTHSKIVSIDDGGRILNFSTQLTGELIEVVAKYSILKSSLDLSCKDFSEEYLKKGYAYTLENGLNAALFKVRVLSNLLSCQAEQSYSFFVGAVLCAEIETIRKTGKQRVVLVGRHPLCKATKILVESYSEQEVICLDDECSAYAAVYGMLKIYAEKRRLDSK